MAEPETLFYDRLIDAYVDRPDYLRRDWLAAAVDAELDRPDCRFVLIVAEPGAGKTAALAGLARDRPEWLRYFIRQDSTTPLSGGDSGSFLLRLGHQLAARRPAIFAPDRLEIVIRQRVGAADADANVVGARIEQLRASPFHRTAIQVEQDIGHVAGELVGLEIGQATADPRLLEPDVLTNLALIDPLTALDRLDPSARVVVLVDALDEVIGFRGSQSILEWMEQVAQLPPNIRFVVTSRPHTRLDLLRRARAGELREVPIDPSSPQVREDVRSYALGVFAGLVDDEYLAATKLATAADGNFAYVSA